MTTFHVLTIFPEALGSYIHTSILGKAVDRKLLKVLPLDFRRFSKDRHHKVDERAFGGGPGMVLKIEPVYAAIQSLKLKGKKNRIILFSTRGKQFTQADARRLARYDHLVLICGRYEGVDERVAAHVADEEFSIGPYILSGGELPALVVTEAVARHIPSVLGKHESLEEIKGSYPVYTRPETFRPKGARGKGWVVPKVLLSGDHKKISEWRRRHA